MSTYSLFEVVVSQIEIITPKVKCFTLMAKDGTALPPFKGGSHIIVQMSLPEASATEPSYSNAYSLMNSPFETDRYQIAVQLSDSSRGGSAFMHQQVKVGDKLTISEPNNLFPLAEKAENHVLIAGGIGITPFMSQLYELQKKKASFQLHYCFRSAEETAFLPQLAQSALTESIFYHSSSQKGRVDFVALLEEIQPDSHIYVCGSTSVIDAVSEAAKKCAFPAQQLHIEQFSVENKSGGAFSLYLARSGIELEVESDMTILQAIEKSKAAKVNSLCREGICGTCEVNIIEGEADHRDNYFTDEERASQSSLLICCSRSKGSV